MFPVWRLAFYILRTHFFANRFPHICETFAAIIRSGFPVVFRIRGREKAKTKISGFLFFRIFFVCH